MATTGDLYLQRKGLHKICEVPDEIISVYALEKHIWADGNSDEARAERRPELQTIREFQFGPVRSFFMDILRNMAAPYRPDDKTSSIGQGYWIQAEFGSGKSHLMCALASLALGGEEAWDIVNTKEKEAERGRRESLYRFWEEGLREKNSGSSKGIFVIMKTLVGSGGGVVGHDDKGGRLVDYILDAARDQLYVETGKVPSLYPVEILADRFLEHDVERYQKDLRKFLKDPTFASDERFEFDEFIEVLQSDKTPDYKRSAGDRLWQFYTQYLKVTPNIAAETEEVLKHLVQTILSQGYSGVLLLLDEVSLFMQNRSEEERADDEKTLVVLANRLAKIHNLPIWTVCSAQQKIESKMGAKNIIADDRLKLVELLKEEEDYYDIVLSRVRKIVDQDAIHNYYVHYRRGFTWPNSIGEEEFSKFFPFHRPALEVIRAVTYELTTARSAIHFMHQTLKEQIKQKGNELIRLWEMFNEAISYEEDPSGVKAAISAIRTKREEDYRIYQKCKTQIDSATNGQLKVHRDKAVMVLQTLFLYHIARTRTAGLEPEELSNNVLVARREDSSPEENIQHYETLSESLRQLLPQIQVTHGDEGKPRYRFEPIAGGPNPADEFRNARDYVQSNPQLLAEAWQHLLALDEWPVRGRQATIDLSQGQRSIFRDIAHFVGTWEDQGRAKSGPQELEVNWRGRIVQGEVRMNDLQRLAAGHGALPPVVSDQTDQDFRVVIGERPIPEETIAKLLADVGDPRVMLWVPDKLTKEEEDRLTDFAAYRKVVKDWQGKDSEDAAVIINWIAEELRTSLAKIKMIVDNSYDRGRLDALNQRNMEPHVAGQLSSVLAEPVCRMLTGVYQSDSISFDVPAPFRNEEAVKVINGIVRTGEIAKNMKPNKDTNAVQNYGVGLGIIKKSAEKTLDIAGNQFTADMLTFIEEKLTDESGKMPVETLYKNFMGVGGPKDYGLTRRLVQLYLLCLTRSGQLRVHVGPRSGLQTQTIDYSNMADVDFSAKVLDNITHVQRMVKPEHWGVLRPYAEKLLHRDIDDATDDAGIQEVRSELRKLFMMETERAAELAQGVKSLFETLQTVNPYADELGQMVALFATDLDTSDDILRLLLALQEIFGYSAFDKEMAFETEVDDLANRVSNYEDLKRFLTEAPVLIAGRAYCQHRVPEDEAFAQIRQMQVALNEKLSNPHRYIDNELAMRTELIGSEHSQATEQHTIWGLIGEYAELYISYHDRVHNEATEAITAIDAVLDGKEMSALSLLEGVSALQPAVSEHLRTQIEELRAGVFTCDSPSRASVEAYLKQRPTHECGLTAVDAERQVAEARQAKIAAASLLDSALESRLAVLMTRPVRERLTQKTDDPNIAGILECKAIEELQDYLVPLVLDEPGVVDQINRCLKQVRVKKVELSEFHPSLTTVEEEQVEQVVAEFRQFLMDKLQQVDAEGNSLAMLQLE